MLNSAVCGPWTEVWHPWSMIYFFMHASVFPCRWRQTPQPLRQYFLEPHTGYFSILNINCRGRRFSFCQSLTSDLQVRAVNMQHTTFHKQNIEPYKIMCLLPLELLFVLFVSSFRWLLTDWRGVFVFTVNWLRICCFKNPWMWKEMTQLQQRRESLKHHCHHIWSSCKI